MLALKGSHKYEFGGPLGAFAIIVCLPLVVYIGGFLCNEISGCPVPSALHPESLTFAKLKEETGWPANGVFGLISLKSSVAVLGYYLFSLILQTVLPGTECQGQELISGGRLQYKFNGFSSAVITVLIALLGTVLQGPDFVFWTFIWDHYIELISVNLCISFFLAAFVYVRSFSVKAGNPQMRELAAGGHSGNIVYDFFIGRELNPRVHLPLFGTIDIKAFCEMRPGLLGWVLLNLAFVVHQYKLYGYISDSIVLLTIFQAFYVFDALYMEPAIITTIDITTDGFGFMLAFGDLVWVPFIYSLQARYLAVYPVHLGIAGILGILAVQGLGYYLFRSANNEKNLFRKNPDDPKVAHLKYMDTASGSKLLVSGWWSIARHINYLGDWIMAWSYCLPTGISGYLIQRSSATGSGTVVVQGEAKGWGIPITYFYLFYFTVLLVHREIRDEDKCKRKYGNDWEKYKKLVPWRILPGVY